MTMYFCTGITLKGPLREEKVQRSEIYTRGRRFHVCLRMADFNIVNYLDKKLENNVNLTGRKVGIMSWLHADVPKRW